MTKYHFHIITPSYNQAQFIGQTIDSIKQQSLLTEHVILDGLSTDQTAEVVGAKQHSKLSFIRQADEGQTDAINKGLDQLSIENDDTAIVAYLNSDDCYLPNAFEAVNKAFNENPSKQWLVGDAIIINESSQEIQKVIRFYKHFFRQFLSLPLLLILNPIPQPAVFMRASAIKQVGPFNTKLHYVMDYEYWLRLFSKLGAPIILNEEIAQFRIHTQSKGGTGYKDQFKEQLSIATSFTNNTIVLFLHALHKNIIIAVYNLVK